METSLPKDIYHVKGSRPGPAVVILGGTHGDERNAITCVTKLLSHFGLSEKNPSLQRDDIHGELFIGFGNPRAIKKQSRSAEGHRDLNRCFVPEDLAQVQDSDSEDMLRARELAPFLQKADYSIDIHGTTSESVPFLASAGEQTQKHFDFYASIPVRHVLTDPNNVLVGHREQQSNGTTDEYVNRNGGIGVTYEIGFEGDSETVPTAFKNIMGALRRLGVFVEKSDSSEEASEQHIFALTDLVVAKEDQFMYKGTMQQGWQRVERGQVIGTYASGDEESAPRTGMCLFPKSPDRVEKGRSLYYIATEIG